MYLSGVVRPELEAMGVGYMLTPDMGNAVDLSHRWAADTGCYTRGERFSLPRYLDWLEARAPYQATCLFATAPDVVGDAAATWTRSAPVLPVLRAMGYRAALVAQNGLEAPQWDTFDALFIGGTTAWKLADSTRQLVLEAKRRGKWVHMGRVNSLRRLRAAEFMGCDSADGTYLKFGPDANLPKLINWLRVLRAQPQFEVSA